MARVKSPYKKVILRKAGKEVRPVPAWVMVKTKRHVRSSPKQRNWRRQRIKP